MTLLLIYIPKQLLLVIWKALKWKPSANCACAVPLMDGWAGLLAQSPARVWHGLATVVDSMRESMHALRCGFLFLQGTQSKRIRSRCEPAYCVDLRMRTAYWWFFFLFNINFLYIRRPFITKQKKQNQKNQKNKKTIRNAHWWVGPRNAVRDPASLSVVSAKSPF